MLELYAYRISWPALNGNYSLSPKICSADRFRAEDYTASTSVGVGVGAGGEGG